MSLLWRDFFSPTPRKGEFRLLYDFTDDSIMPRFLIYPAALMGMKLNATETGLYLLLLDRSRLSAMNEGWRDGQGRIWCVYPVRSLAARLGCSATNVKNGLRRLEARGLIARQKTGLGKADRIFVRLPGEDAPPRPSEGRGSASPEVRGPDSAEWRKPASPEVNGPCPPRSSLLAPNKN